METITKKSTFKVVRNGKGGNHTITLKRVSRKKWDEVLGSSCWKATAHHARRRRGLEFLRDHGVIAQKDKGPLDFFGDTVTAVNQMSKNNEWGILLVPSGTDIVAGELLRPLDN